MHDRTTREQPSHESPGGIPISRRPSLASEGGSLARLIKGSHVPLYYQLAVILENRMETGEYTPGQRFPSEAELCHEFDVSRAVVRPAVAILEREGRLERAKGRGTFVRPPKATHDLGGLARVVATQPRGMVLDVIEARNEEPGGEAEQLLTPSPDRAIRRITAVLRTDDAPTALFWSFLSVPEVGWAEGLSAGNTVRVDELENPLLVAGGECVVETSWSTDFESSSLDIPPGTPILVVHCTEVAHFAEAPELRTVEAAWVMCRADALRVRARLGAAAPRSSRAREHGSRRAARAGEE